MTDAVLAAPPPPTQATRAAVLLPTALDQAFDYLVPEGTAPGAVVEATLAGRKLVGVVQESGIRDQGSEKIPVSKLKPITRVVDAIPPLNHAFLQWLDWVAEFTLAPRGAVLSLCGLAYAAKTTRKKFAAPAFNLRLPVLTNAQQAVAAQLCESVAAGERGALETLPLRGRAGVGAELVVGAEWRTHSPSITMPIPATRDFARTLRAEMTDAENELWYYLRREGLGVKFRKQHPIGKYIADFACLNPKLIIELDGGQHTETDAVAHDAARTAFLEAQGFKVLRFWNNDVLENMAGVWERVVEVLDTFSPPPQLTQPPPLPSPSGGGSLALRASVPGISRLKPILLDGVTGSGKTEVYFHAIAAALGFRNDAGSGPVHRDSENPSPHRGEVGRGASVTPSEQITPPQPVQPPPLPSPSGGGSSALRACVATDCPQILVLLPEIALTHQWLERFEKTFGAAPIAWHSRMTPAAKARAWQAIARGEAQVVVGARSALFLPFANLALIVVDEEHDASYKQEDGVLYHARDMAVARAQFAQIPIILASATPSLETLENVRRGKYRALQLPDRYGAAGMPDVRLVDMRNDPPERGDFISPIVKKAALETLARGEQVLFFLNRRGYAPLLLCRGCGHRFQCKHCSAWLVVHGKRVTSDQWPAASKQENAQRTTHGSLHCHHCGHREKFPEHCPACKAESEKLAPCGPGVERIAEEVRGMLVTGHWSLVTLSSDESIPPETWAAIEAGSVDILVGTQMVAKGHHFPRLTLVIVVDADVGLSGADLRAGERTFQMLHQLGGRAGRGALAGTVLIQTYVPEHPVMQSLAADDRNRLMALEAQERKAGGWPPFGQLAAILLDGVEEAKVRAAGQALARSAPADARLTVLGPAPAPLSKLRGQFRYRLLIKAKPGIHLQRTLRGWLAGQKFPGVRVKVDVNPYYFM